MKFFPPHISQEKMCLIITPYDISEVKNCTRQTFHVAAIKIDKNYPENSNLLNMRGGDGCKKIFLLKWEWNFLSVEGKLQLSYEKFYFLILKAFYFTHLKIHESAPRWRPHIFHLYLRIELLMLCIWMSATHILRDEFSELTNDDAITCRVKFNTFSHDLFISSLPSPAKVADPNFQKCLFNKPSTMAAWVE